MAWRMVRPPRQQPCLENLDLRLGLDQTCLLTCLCTVQGKLPDYNDPVILPRRYNTVEGFCNRIHKGAHTGPGPQPDARITASLIGLRRSCCQPGLTASRLTVASICD